MPQLNGVSKSYGDNTILEEVSLVLNHGDGLGFGRAQWLRQDHTAQDRRWPGGARPGQRVLSPPDLSVGYLEQGLTSPEGATVGQIAHSDLIEGERQVKEIAEQMSRAAGDGLYHLLADYSRAWDRFEAAGGHAGRARVDSVLAGLGLDGIAQDTPVDILSGGQKTRLGLARLLLKQPRLLLLDEPTNHLDIEALEWLERFLADYDGAVLIVSHDRTFLDRTVGTILELDPLTHKLTAYPGDYTDYVTAKERERDKLWASFRDQQDRVAQYKLAIGGLETYSRNIERGTINFAPRKIAKGLARKATVQKRRLERLLQSEEHIDKPKPTWQMKLDFVDTPASSQDVLLLEAVSMGFGERVLFEDVTLTMRAGERVVLTGPNGSGKTTLLRIVTGRIAPLAGRTRLGASVRVGYYSQEQEGLDHQADAFTEIRRVASMSDTEVRHFLHYFLFAGEDVFVPIGLLSYGERARLALAKLVASGCNLLLLDEPINHLDIPSRERFEQGLSRFEGSVLAVVHDRYFIERFATRIWAIHGRAIRSYVDLDDMRRGAASDSPASLGAT